MREKTGASRAPVTRREGPGVKTLSFGAHRRQAKDRRPLFCSDHGGLMVAGEGEPTYGLCDACRQQRGVRAFQKSHERHKRVPRKMRL